jgi:hypothetical protein
MENQTIMKPKPLRIVGSCIIVFAMLFSACAVFFDVFVAPLDSRTSLLLLIISLSNLLQATLLFMWADILKKHDSGG